MPRMKIGFAGSRPPQEVVFSVPDEVFLALRDCDAAITCVCVEGASGLFGFGETREVVFGCSSEQALRKGRS
jgi:hypothetical protein